MNNPVDWGVGRYERTAEKLFPAAQVLVDSAALRSGERVLDLGCGTGNVAVLAAAAGAQVTAVDPSPRLLDVTRAAAQRENLDVTCEVGEAAAVPSPDASFDCLLSNFGVIFAPDPEAAAAEIARVLRADGRALFTAWLPGGAVGALSAAAQELVRAALGAPSASPAFAWHDEPALETLFSRHGMSATVESVHELVSTAVSPHAYLEAQRTSHPMAVTGFEVLQQRGQAEEAYDHLLKVLNEHNEDPGAFRSTSRYAVVVARPA
jgi:ubiquinone/menaquinone biosynthesis C-methylase UbiE